MNSKRVKYILAEIISAVFVGLFVYAALSKFIDFDNFQIQLGQSPLLTPFVGLVTWTIPPVEMLIAALLTSDKTRMIGLYASFFLMSLFSFYIVAITGYSYFIPCSCGGILQHMSWHQHLIFNLVFVFLAALAILIYNKPNHFVAIKSGETENLY